MQDVKIYIVIENKKTGQETNISGSLELLNAFLKGIVNIEAIPTEGVIQLVGDLSSIQEPQT